LTPQQFLSNPQAQDKVFDHVFGGYLKQGSPSDAASRWFTGRPLSQGGNKRDVSGTSGNRYVNMFNKNLRQDSSGPPPQMSGQQGEPQPRDRMPITQRHIDYLKKNPKLAPAFDEKFGPGSAARFLGGGM
jgi:hypothetical protein